MYFLLGLAFLLLSLYAARTLLGADPKTLARVVRKLGGAALIAVAVVLLLRGALIAAVPLGLIGLSLLGYGLRLPGGFGSIGGGSRRAGQRSRVRTAFIDMMLDHDTGKMDGRVIAGRFEGKLLSSLGLAELLDVWRECRGRDAQSARLLEAYLDHRMPEWRRTAGGGAAGGGGQARNEGRMSAEEAYEILGLAPGASASDVRRAHRDLMKKLHPDRGGSNYIAAKINQAKDVLLRASR